MKTSAYSFLIPHIFESLFTEIALVKTNSKSRADLDILSMSLFEAMDIINTEHKYGIIMGDMNVDLLKFETHAKTSENLKNIYLKKKQ